MAQKIFSNNVANIAMSYGTYMGIFWILKFTLVPPMFSYPLISLLFVILTLAVPFIGYYFARNYRNKHCPEQSVSFLQAWIFCLFMYTFAAILTSVAHYIYFQYIDEGHLFESYTRMMEDAQAAMPALSSNLTTYEEALNTLNNLTPINLTLQLISNNIFYGMIYSLPTALIVSWKRNRKNIQSDNQ